MKRNIKDQMKEKKNIEHITEYEKYNSKNPLVKLVVNKFIRDLFRYMVMIEPDYKKNIIDIGCGDGYILRELVKRNRNSFIMGLDLSPETLRFSRKLNPSVSLMQASIQQIPCKNESFGLVVNLQVLEHLKEPWKAVIELRRISKGYCIIGVPYEPFFRMANIARLKYLIDFGNYPDHINHWNKSSFRRFLKKYFKKVRIKSSTIWLIAICRK